jgi:hypothetical protein
MWEIKREKVSLPSLPDFPFERVFLQEGDGPKLMWKGFGGYVREGNEKFEYEDGVLSFGFVASRFNQSSGLIGPRYTVWLGLALQAISERLGESQITIARARRISKDIKSGLLVWRYPERVAQELGCNPAATEVALVMTQWAKWSPQLEHDWP